MSLCCDSPEIHVTRETWGWSAHCSNCYDGAIDSSNRNEVGNGGTAHAALLDWMDSVEFNRDEPDDGDPFLQKQLDRLDYANDQRKDDKLWER
jgi:hypothetical protein